MIRWSWRCRARRARTLSFSLRAAIGADYAVAEHEGAWWLTRAGEPLLAARS